MRRTPVITSSTLICVKGKLQLIGTFALGGNKYGTLIHDLEQNIWSNLNLLPPNISKTAIRLYYLCGMEEENGCPYGPKEGKTVLKYPTNSQSRSISHKRWQNQLAVLMNKHYCHTKTYRTCLLPI